MKNFIIKIIAIVIIFFLCVDFSEGTDNITKLFMKYNKTQAAAFSTIVYEAGKEFNIQPEVIASIILVESSVRPYVISKGGNYGLMQVRYKVHKDKVKSANDLLDPKTNIRVGTKIFAQYYAQKKTLRAALIRYSGGNKKMADKVLRILKKCL